MSIIFCIGEGGGVAADIDPCYRVAYPLSFTSLESKLSWASSDNFEEHGTPDSGRSQDSSYLKIA